VTDFDVAQRFVQIVAAAHLPLPDQMDSDAHGIVLTWSTTGFQVHLDREADHFGPIDELEAAMIKDVPPDQWPWPTPEGYADYVPRSSKSGD
jgi:hypothetical protein